MVSTKGILILSIFAGSLIWTAALSRPDGRYHIWNTSSKSQVSLLIKSPQGKFAVVNPGSSLLAGALSDKLPFYDRGIDLVVLSSKNGGSSLSSLKQRFQIKKILDISAYTNISNHDLTEQTLSRQTWEGLGFESWTVPDQDVFLKIRRGAHSLIYLSRNNPAFWEAVPYTKDAEEVIDGPSPAEIVW